MYYKLKILIAIATLLTISSKIIGQGFTPTSTYFNDDTWFFGSTGVGIEFKSGVPKDKSGESKVVSGENSLSVSTPACDGGFVFYTSHSYVYNTKHLPMKGGVAADTAATPGLFYGNNSVADGLAACYIGNNKYFLISSSNAYETSNSSNPIGLYYYEVDMNKHKGMGELSKAKTLETKDMSESVEIIPIPNEYNKYWLVYYHIGRKEMTVCKITSTGIERQSGLCISYDEPGTHSYQFKRSPNNDKLALAQPLTNRVTVFDFNPTTGVISKKYTFYSGLTATYGIEFSPNSKYLFVAGWNNNGIAQFELGTTGATKVSSGVYQPTNNGGGGLKLGPDGRIYVMRNIGGKYVGVINTPNQVVNFSNTTHYNPNGFELSASYGGLTLSTGLTPPGEDPPGNNLPPQPKPDYATTTDKTSVTVAVVANDVDPNKVTPGDISGLFLTQAEFLNSGDVGKGTLSFDENSKTITFVPKLTHNFTDGEQIVVKYRLRNDGIPVGLCSDAGRLTITVKKAKLSWTFTKTTIEEGGDLTTVTVCMPENAVAPAGGIVVTLEPQSSSTATSTDYTISPALSATIAAGNPCVSFTIKANEDLIVEKEEKLDLIAKAPNFTSTPSQTIKIVDKTPGDIIVEKYSPAGDASEPNTHGSFRIYFKKDNVICAKPTEVIFILSGTAENGKDYTLISPLKAKIDALQHECFVTITVEDNYIVQGARDVKITLDSATMN